MKLVMEFDSAAQAREELTVLLGISSAPVPVAEPEAQPEVEEPKKRGRPKKVTTQDEPPKAETVDSPKVETVDSPKVEPEPEPKVEVTEQALRELCLKKAEKVGHAAVKEIIGKVSGCAFVAEIPADKRADVYEAVKNLPEETL